MDWPIIVDEAARDRLVERVMSQRARVQLLQGPSGIGKSTLAASVAARLEASGHPILPIVAMPELKDVPLGALAPVLATTGSPLAESTGERLQRLFALVSPVGSRQVLVVDDGPMLDDVSASTIYQLVRIYGVRCVMTARTEHPLTGPLLRLRDEGHIDVTELHGLSGSVAADLAQRALQATVESGSLRAIVERAGGNPLFLRELLRAAVAGDAMRESGAGLQVDATALPERLRETIALRFGGLDDEERSLAELIAVAGPVPRELLTARRALERLDAAGLLAQAVDDEVYLSHPLFGETLLELMTEDRRDERREEAATLLLAGTREDLRFKAVCLLAETSSSPPIEQLAWAAAYAHNVDDHALAIRLSTRAIEEAAAAGRPMPFGAALTRADALSVSGRLDEADQAFDEADTAAVTDQDRAHAATRRGFYLSVRRQRPVDAVRMGTAVLESMPDSPIRDYLTANIAKWRLMAGDAPTLEHSPSSDADDVTNAFNTDLYRMMAAILAADLEAARAAIETGRPRAQAARMIVRHGVELMDFGDFFVTAFEGRVHDALAFAEQKRGDRIEESTGMWNYGLALFTLHDGRIEEALGLAARAAEQLAWRDFLGALGAATALEATAAARLGRRRRAREILDSIEPNARTAAVTELHVAEAEAWILVHEGDIPGAVDLIERAVDRGIQARYFALACFTAYAAVRLGHSARVLEQLRLIGAETSGELVGAMVAHAEASAADDAEALLSVADRLASAGVREGAVDAARQSARIARREGKDRAARRASYLAGQWSRGLSGAGHLPQEDGAYTLSEREWSIATAAAGRKRSKEIAERLGLSVRTVDNHLTNIYRKLGVAGRDGLRAELESLS